MKPSDVTSAAAVSSQDVSTPRITSAFSGDRLPDGVLPHDESVFPIVRVVTAADAVRLEPEAFVECDRARVRDPHLEGVAAAGIACRRLEELVEQPARHALPAI